jgi:hypothetical protein
MRDPGCRPPRWAHRILETGEHVGKIVLVR